MHKGILIPDDLVKEPSICELEEPLYMSLGNAVGGFFEIVNISDSNSLKKLRFIVNDCGAINGMILNLRASLIAQQAIYGPAILMKEDFTEEGPDIVGLTDYDLKALGFDY